MNYQIDVLKISTLEDFINGLLKEYKVAFIDYKRSDSTSVVHVFKEHVLKDFVNVLLDILIMLKVEYKIENDELTIEKNCMYAIDETIISNLVKYTENIQNEYSRLLDKYKELLVSANHESDITIDIHLQTNLYKLLGIHFFLNTANLKLVVDNKKFKILRVPENEACDLYKKLNEFVKQRDENILERIKLSKKIDDINDEMLLEQKRIKLIKLNRTVYDDSAYVGVVSKIKEYNECIKEEFIEIRKRYKNELDKNVDILKNVIYAIGVDIENLANFEDCFCKQREIEREVEEMQNINEQNIS